MGSKKIILYGFLVDQPLPTERHDYICYRTLFTKRENGQSLFCGLLGQNGKPTPRWQLEMPQGEFVKVCGFKTENGSYCSKNPFFWCDVKVTKVSSMHKEWKWISDLLKFYPLKNLSDINQQSFAKYTKKICSILKTFNYEPNQIVNVINQIYNYDDLENINKNWNDVFECIKFSISVLTQKDNSK